MRRPARRRRCGRAGYEILEATGAAGRELLPGVRRAARR